MPNVRVAEIAAVMQRDVFLLVSACLVACSSGNRAIAGRVPTVLPRQMSAMINGISWMGITVDVDLTIDPAVIRVTAT